MGNQGHFVTIAPVLADALFAQARRDEAAPLIELGAPGLPGSRQPLT
jgi:hypothetical protein